MVIVYDVYWIFFRNELGRWFVYFVLRKFFYWLVFFFNCIVCYKCIYFSVKYLNIYIIFLYSKMFKFEIEGLLNNDGMFLSYIIGYILS